MCYMIWQRGIKFVDEIVFAKQLTLKYGQYPGLADGPNVITRVFKYRRRRK